MAKKIQRGKGRKATREDVELMLKVASLYNTDYDFEASEWFWREFHENTFLEFRSKYPQGTKGAQLFERFTSRFEYFGVLIEYGFLNEDLFFDRYGSLQAEWEKAKPIVYGLRKEWNEPRFRENFELLARRGQKWLERHPPKIK
jgi:hypothetical protein